MSDNSRMETNNQDVPNTEDPSSDGVSTERAAYNVVSDTVTGVNIRKSDNLFQAAFIAVTMFVLAITGAILASIFGKGDIPWYAGAIAGALAGLVVGVFASGIFLMIYRAVRHMTGKHD